MLHPTDFSVLILLGSIIFSIFLILSIVITFWHDNDGSRSILDMEFDFSLIEILIIKLKKKILMKKLNMNK